MQRDMETFRNEGKLRERSRTASVLYKNDDTPRQRSRAASVVYKNDDTPRERRAASVEYKKDDEPKERSRPTSATYKRQASTSQVETPIADVLQLHKSRRPSEESRPHDDYLTTRQQQTQFITDYPVPPRRPRNTAQATTSQVETPITEVLLHKPRRPSEESRRSDDYLTPRQQQTQLVALKPVPPLRSRSNSHPPCKPENEYIVLIDPVTQLGNDQYIPPLIFRTSSEPFKTINEVKVLQKNLSKRNSEDKRSDLSVSVAFDDIVNEVQETTVQFSGSQYSGRSDNIYHTPPCIMPKCCSPKRTNTCVLLIVLILILFIIWIVMSVDTPRHLYLRKQIADMQSRIKFIEAQCESRQKDIKFKQGNKRNDDADQTTSTISPQDLAALKNLTDFPILEAAVKTQSILGIKRYLDPSDLTDIYNTAKTKKYYKPAFHVQSKRDYVDFVIGIPSIQRDKENYLDTTLRYLFEGLTREDYNTTMIIIMIGEVDLVQVMSIAKMIEYNFKKELEDGLIEIISPEKDFYPDFNTLPTTLGDPPNRVRWRTKQNLDAIFLMSYAKFKGKHYLMLEDDVIAKPHYMHEIKSFAAATTISHPGWVLVDFSQIGGIGKLFKTPDLAHFTAYVDLFHVNMPLDWLIDSYIANRACGIDKNSKDCVKRKAEIRIQHETSLFQHIGLYSSLKGKVQKLKDPKFGKMPLFVPHNNPPVTEIKCSIEERSDHTFKDAYEGRSYFWGITPKKEDHIIVHFKQPTVLKSLTIRTGNIEHLSDIFKDTDVCAKLYGEDEFATIGEFNNLGVATVELPENFGALSAVKIHVKSDSDYWVIISEIHLETAKDAA